MTASIIIPNDKMSASSLFELCPLAPSVREYYTDGSKTGKGVGLGVAVTEDRDAFAEYTQPLSPNSSVFQAELLAISFALNIHCDAWTNHGCRQDMVIYTDSRSVVSALESHRRMKNLDILELEKQLREQLALCPFRVSLQWIPGHADIEGNELADNFAKSAANSESQERFITFTSPQIIRSAIGRWFQFQCDNWWSNKRSKSYVPASRPSAAHLKRMFEGLSISQSSLLAQYRCGHPDLAINASRFHQNQSALCHCGQLESVQHVLFFCPGYDHLRSDLVDEVYEATGNFYRNERFLLDNPSIAKPVSNFLVSAMKLRRDRL